MAMMFSPVSRPIMSHPRDRSHPCGPIEIRAEGLPGELQTCRDSGSAGTSLCISRPPYAVVQGRVPKGESRRRTVCLPCSVASGSGGVKKTMDTGENIRRSLTKLDLSLPMEHIAFDSNGDPLYYRHVVVQIQKGKFVVVYPPDRASGHDIYPMPVWEKR